MLELELLKIIHDYQGAALVLALIIILVIQFLKFTNGKKENIKIFDLLNKIESNHFSEINNELINLRDRFDMKFDKIIELLIKIESNLKKGR